MNALARVLVVDDAVDIAEVLQDYLGDEGYEVRIADNGRVGLDLFDAWRPHVVLLDLHLPEIGGAELFRRIRAMQPTAAVIFVTGADDEALARRLLREGAADYVRKPIDLEYCAMAVLLSVARGAAPGQDAASEELVQAVYRLVRRVRGMDDVWSRLREELEQLSFAALRDALAHETERAHQHLAMFRHCLETAHPAALPPADRAELDVALADTAASHS
jgi:two-component system response regulator (stage 0 sporulation protein F)